MPVSHQRHSQAFDEGTFANAGHTGYAKTNCPAGMRQQFINDLARQLLVIRARALDQRDGFGQQPAIPLADTPYIYIKIFWVHVSI